MKKRMNEFVYWQKVNQARETLIKSARDDGTLYPCDECIQRYECERDYEARACDINNIKEVDYYDPNQF